VLPPAIVPAHCPEKREWSPSQVVRLSLKWAERTGLRLALWEAFKQATGRPRILNPMAALMCLYAYSLTRRDKFILLDVPRWVRDNLTNVQRTALGLTEDLTYNQLLSTLNALCEMLWPQDYMPKVYYLKGAKKGKVKRLRRDWLGMDLSEFLTRLVSAAIPECLPPSKDLALDATDAESWIKPSKWDPVKGEWVEANADHGSKVGHRTSTPKKPNEFYSGRAIHSIVDVADMGGVPRPCLCRAMSVGPANATVYTMGLKAVDSYMKLYGQIVGVLISDEGYTQCAAENWALELMKRLVTQCMDYKVNEGNHDYDQGKNAYYVEGNYYTSGTPEDLLKLRRPDSDKMTPEQVEELLTQRDERAHYRFTVSTKMNPVTLTLRLKGPALTMRVRCVNNPATLSIPYGDAPDTTCVLGEDCSCGKTITIGPEDHADERQQHPFGTHRQFASYSRRVAVEWWHAELHNIRGNLNNETFQTRTINLTEILIGIYAAATNACIIRDYYITGHSDLRDEGEEAVLTVPPVPARRRKPRKIARHRLLKAVGLEPPG